MFLLYIIAAISVHKHLFDPKIKLCILFLIIYLSSNSYKRTTLRLKIYHHFYSCAHTVLSANVRASGHSSLPVYASACRTFIVNGHAALCAAPPPMKARWLRACPLDSFHRKMPETSDKPKISGISF